MNGGIRLVALAALVASLGAGCAVDTAAPDEVGQTRAAQSSFFLYFRCNATGWGVDDATRLTETSLGSFERSYAVTESWMVSDGDTCILTQTDQLNGWGTSQTFFGPARIDRIIVPGGDFLDAQAPGGDEHFKVQYPALGSYQVLANFLQGTILIRAAP